MRRLFAGLIGLTLTAMAFAAVPAVATSAPPHVTVHPVHSDVSATARLSIDYHAYDLRSGSRVVLQVRQGSGWLSLARTKERSGTFHGTFAVEGPGELGRYTLRAKVVRAGRDVVYSLQHRIHAYGPVTLHDLCNGVLDGDCEPGTRHLDHGESFHYVLLTGVNEPSDGFSAQIGAAQIACRSITLHYISDSQDTTNTYLELRQAGHKPVKHTSSSAKVGTFTAPLTGKKFGVSVEQDAAQVFMYFSGAASCYTATGKV